MIARRLAHLRALYRLLSGGGPACLLDKQNALVRDWREAGLLRWVALVAANRSELPELRLGVSDELSGRLLQGALTSPLDGHSVPARFERSGVAAIQSGGDVVRGSVANATRGGFPGSIGAFATDRSGARGYLVTAAHVAAGSSSARADDDIAIVVGDRRFSGRLANWSPAMGSDVFSTRIDAAIVAVDAASLSSLSERVRLPTGSNRLVFGDTPVTLWRTNEPPLSGSFKAWWSGWVNARLSLDGHDYWLEDGAAILYDPPFSAGGDSGAGVWDENERLVGFHCAGMSDTDLPWNAVACEADEVLDHFGLRLLTRSTTGLQPPVASNSASALSRGALRAPPAAVLPAAGERGDTSAEVDTLARTLWGEARGEADPARSMAAVAAVVLNRRRRQTYWGKTIVEVCRKPWQFSCWNRNDPNLPQLLRVTRADARFVQALAIAADACGAAAFRDETKGATHYYARGIARPPAWAAGKVPCETIGRHLFFNDIP